MVRILQNHIHQRLSFLLFSIGSFLRILLKWQFSQSFSINTDIEKSYSVSKPATTANPDMRLTTNHDSISSKYPPPARPAPADTSEMVETGSCNKYTSELSLGNQPVTA